MCEKITDNSEATNKKLDVLTTSTVQEIEENIDLTLPKQDEDNEEYILWLA